MRQAVKLLRSCIYFPLDVAPTVRIPYRVARWYLRQIIAIDAPLVRYLVGTR